MADNNMSDNKVERENTNKNASVIPNFEPYDGRDPYIFISYAHADNEVVNGLMNTLSDEKFRLWFDAGLEVGNDFRDELVEKIKNCCAMIFFASERSFISKYCATEIINAVKYDIKIFPFFLSTARDAAIPSQLEMVIGNLHHIYYYDNPDKCIRELINALPKDAMHALAINEDGVVTKCKDGNNIINIPDYYEGKKVTTIGVGAFRLCMTLEKITFGPYIHKIESEAFRGCSSIKELILPEVIDSIGESAFRDCINLEKLVIERNIDIMDRAFENCPLLHTIVFPEDFAEVNNGVFNSCKALKSVKLPDNVTIIGESAFSDCDKLEKIEVPFKTIKINDFAFSNCKQLKEIVFNEKLKKIGKNAFQYCTSIDSLALPRSLSTIEGGAFKGCKNLVQLKVDSKNKHYRTFNNVLFTKNKSELIAYAPKLPEKSYEIPDSVVRVSNYAFFGCQNLVSVIIPDSVFDLGEGAFYDCSNLETLIIPDSVVRIEDMCFRNCTNLRRIEIPDSVQDIGWGLFRGCSCEAWKNEDFELIVICSYGSVIAKYCDGRGIKHIQK